MSDPYADRAWRRVRKLVLERDGYRCQIAGRKCKGVATHADHIVSVSDGGPRLDPAKLRAACASCNVAKPNREVAERARAMRAQATAAGASRTIYPPNQSGYDW